MVGRIRGIACASGALGFAVATALAGCSSESASAESEATLQASDGPFAGTLMITPSPPRVGQHHVVVVLSEEEMGEPLEGATVLLSPWMPAHGHGTPDVEAHEEEPGVYVADDVWLNMPGVWDLRVHVEAEAQGDLKATVEVP